MIITIGSPNVTPEGEALVYEFEGPDDAGVISEVDEFGNLHVLSDRAGVQAVITRFAAGHWTFIVQGEYVD